jgi:hypothetical protein
MVKWFEHDHIEGDSCKHISRITGVATKFVDGLELWQRSMTACKRLSEGPARLLTCRKRDEGVSARGSPGNDETLSLG